MKNWKNRRMESWRNTIFSQTTSSSGLVTIMMKKKEQKQGRKEKTEDKEVE